MAGCGELEKLPRLLALCRKHRYTRIEIYQNKIEVGWSGKDKDTDGPRIDDSPAIWKIVTDLGISWGCGGTDYHQFEQGALPVGLWYRQPGDRKWTIGTRAETYEMLKQEEERWGEWRKQMFGH